MRRTALLALGGFLVPMIVMVLVLGARPDDGRGANLDTFENDNFPFTFDYPEEFSAASAGADVPALSLEGDNAITIQEIEPMVPESGLSTYVAQLLVDQAAEPRSVRRSGLEMVTAQIPREAAGGTAESLLYFFTARGGTFQVDCQFTPDRRRQVVRACRRAMRSVELDS